jgi:hypothetical protein
MLGQYESAPMGLKKHFHISQIGVKTILLKEIQTARREIQ